MQIEMAALSATLAYLIAAASMAPWPPIQRKTVGAESSKAIEKTVARPSAKTRVCRTSALATSRLPAPGPRDSGRDTAAHAAGSGVLDVHDEEEGERYPRKRIRAELAHEDAVESDHAGDGEEIEHIRR